MAFCHVSFINTIIETKQFENTFIAISAKTRG